MAGGRRADQASGNTISPPTNSRLTDAPVVAGAFRWPVTVSWGDLRLRPLGRGDRREWDAVRSRNREWLDPWEATNPVPGGGSPSFAHFVRTLDQQARQATAQVWEGARGLEWTVPSPAPFHTFTTPPVIDDSKLAHGNVSH